MLSDEVLLDKYIKQDVGLWDCLSLALLPSLALSLSLPLLHFCPSLLTKQITPHSSLLFCQMLTSTNE